MIKGILLLIGGRENKSSGKKDADMEILKTFADLAGNRRAVIEVVTTASESGDESFATYREAFTSLGVGEIRHIHHDTRNEALDADLSERLQAATGIFLSGGDQLKLTTIYGGTAILDLFTRRYRGEKIVIAGTSAGAMALSSTMIFAGNKEVQQVAGAVRIATGLSLLTDVCIDTHFVDRSRFVRMAQVVATNPATVGLGIEEDTALLVRNGKQAEVLGSGVVIIIEGFSITATNVLNHEEGDPVYIDNLTVRILARGNQYLIP